MMSRLLKIVTSRLFWSFIGITLIALMIYIAGPMLAFNDYRPLESEFNRIVLIVIIYVLWLLFKIIPKLYAIWLNGKLLKQLSAQQNTGEEDKTDAPPEDNELTERFNEALMVLKKAKLSQESGNKLRWYDRFSSQYIYQLPWYVIIGAPGSGKTTALVNSGLHFPLADQYGKTALRGIGGTRNCDWWFTNEAILLDTAGRYSTQESQREKDASEWLNFVGLLKKFRSRQPINGIILTISVSDLLNTHPDERRIQAIAMRKRLTELQQEFAIYFPVYVMVTKADLLTGFVPYFGLFDKQLRGQIWGFTFPYADMQQSGFSLLAAFDKEYDLLQQRIESALPDTMFHEHDLKKRAEIYQFPQRIALLKGMLRQYLEDVFTSSAFESMLLPRGIYLTSGTQDGLGQVQIDMRGTFEQATPAPIPQNIQNKGQSYFLKGLLQNVIFRESGLAGNNRWWVYRNRALHWAGYIVLTAFTLFACFLWYNSYENNYDYLQTVEQRVPPLSQEARTIKNLKAGDVMPLLTYLNELLALSSGDGFDANNPPWSYRLGLYRGGPIQNTANALYQQALHELLLPHVFLQAENILDSDDGADPDFTYEALKAYLMFYDQEHYDGEYLRDWLIANLQKNLKIDIPRKQRAELNSHYHNLLTAKVQVSPYIRNLELITKTQQALNNASLAKRIYSRLRRVLPLKSGVLDEISLTDLAGPLTDALFKRISGKPNSQGVPGLFTPKGYWDLFDKNIESVAGSLMQESEWVLGSKSSYANNTALFNEVRREYMRDYMQQWDSFLADIQLVDNKSLDQLIDIALALSDKQSPLRELAVNAATATNLKGGSGLLANHQPAVNKAKEKINSTINSRNLGWLLPTDAKSVSSFGLSSDEPENLVTEHFKKLHALATPADSNAKDIPFDITLPVMNALYTQLIALQSMRNREQMQCNSGVSNDLRGKANPLPVPFGDILKRLADDYDITCGDIVDEKTAIALQQEIRPICQQTIANRYPLNRRANIDITPDDLAAMFAPQSGLLDQFYQREFAGKVNTMTNPWSLRKANGNYGSNNILLPFQQASKIRNALFGNSQTPAFKVRLKPVSMDADILSMTLNINGQILRYSHGPQTPIIIEWPGSQNTNQVLLQFSLVNGSSSSAQTNGNWALHKMYDRAIIKNKSGNTKLLTFDLDGRRATLELEPNSAISPFELPAFTCP